MSTTNHSPKPKRRWYQFSLKTLLIVAFTYTVVQAVLAMLWRIGYLPDALMLLFLVGYLPTLFAGFLGCMHILSWLQQDK